MPTNGSLIEINELAEIVDRLPHTIRGWEREGVLPKDLLPVRGPRNRRQWTAEQAKGILEWMRESRRFPGSGLTGYDPTPEEIEERIHRMRAARQEKAVA